MVNEIVTGILTNTTMLQINMSANKIRSLQHIYRGEITYHVSQEPTMVPHPKYPQG
jgi:hypothetical protein